MKKAIIAAVICALLVIAGYQGYNWHKENFSKISKDLKTMKMEDFKEKVKNKESFYVYVGRPNCGDSKIFEAWFIPKYLKGNDKIKEKIYYMDIKKLVADKANWEIFKKEYNIKYTPTLVYYENGEIKDIIEWTAKTDFPESMVVEGLKRNGFN